MEVGLNSLARVVVVAVGEAEKMHSYSEEVVVVAAVVVVVGKRQVCFHLEAVVAVVAVVAAAVQQLLVMEMVASCHLVTHTVLLGAADFHQWKG